MRRAAQDGPMRRAAQLWEGDSSSSSSAHLPATVKIVPKTVQTQIASEIVRLHCSGVAARIDEGSSDLL